MPLKDFYVSLRDTGTVDVDSADDPSLDEIQELKAVLRELDRLTRLELPGTPPPLSMAAVSWAAVTFYRACQFLVFREVEGDEVEATLSRPCPEPLSPACVHSVDLVLRRLPDVVALARGLAPRDPLVEGLVELAHAWPLSSVGIRDLGPVPPDRLEPVMAHPCLRQLYIDRILGTDDSSRVDRPDVSRAVECTLGFYPELSPRMAMHGQK